MTEIPKKWAIRGVVDNQMSYATLYVHFIRTSWWGKKSKYIFLKKDPGENNGNFLLFGPIKNIFICSLGRLKALKTRA